MRNLFERKYFLFFAALLMTGICIGFFLKPQTGPSDNEAKKKSGDTIRVSMQYSMYYVPVYLMQELGILQKYLPDVDIEWSVLGSGSPQNEALAADRLDVAFMGLAPALIGWDKGVSKIMSNLCIAPTSLQVRKPSITKLSDFSSEDKIALPGIGSIQHILLSLAASKVLGDPKALDNNIVSMTHPDGALALTSGADIAAHFTAMPFIVKEVSAGARTILTAEEALGGDCSIIVAVCTEKFRSTKPLFYAAVQSALADAMQLINSRDPEAVKIIAKHEKITPEQVIEYLDWEGTNYTTTLYGVLDVAAHMAKAGYLSKEPKTMDEVTWEGASAAIGCRAGKPSILEQAQRVSGK